MRPLLPITRGRLVLGIVLVPANSLGWLVVADVFTWADTETKLSVEIAIESISLFICFTMLFENPKKNTRALLKSLGFNKRLKSRFSQTFLVRFPAKGEPGSWY